MCGTAAEVTPLRSIDDHEIGVGPVTLAIQEAYLDTVRGQSERWSQWLDHVPQLAAQLSTTTTRINLSAPWIDERDEELVLEVLRSGWLSLGPTGRGSSRCSRTRSTRRIAPRSRRAPQASTSACASRASGRATR